MPFETGAARGYQWQPESGGAEQSYESMIHNELQN